MGRRIRWLGVILVLCFALVIVQLINIQFRQASALANSPNNPRVAATKFDNERGTITASDGTVLAKSVKINSSSSTYNYEREYPDGKFTLCFVGYGDEESTAVIELTYNWGRSSYTLGDAFGHVAIGVDDAKAACDRIRG